MPYLQVLGRSSALLCEGRQLVMKSRCHQLAVWRVVSRLGGELRGTVELVLCDECFREALAQVRAKAGWDERSSSFTR